MKEVITRNLPNGFSLEGRPLQMSPRMFRLCKDGVTIAHVEEWSRNHEQWSIHSYASQATEAKSAVDIIMADFRRKERIDHEIRRDAFIAECTKEQQDRSNAAYRALFGDNAGPSQ